MTDVDKFSDQELRTKLIEYGFPVMPITGTTRKVMVKKLKLLMENKKKIGDTSRRSMGQYSSEEESDVDVKVTKKADKSRRVTMGEHFKQPPASNVAQRRSTRFTDTVEEAPKVITRKEVRVTTSRVVKNSQDDFDTGSESESDIVKKDSSLNYSDYKRSSPIKTTVSSSYTDYSPSRNREQISDRNIFSVETSPSRNSFISTANAAEERLNQIRSRLSLGSPVTDYDKPSYLSPSSSNQVESETPFLSNFTKRLSQMSPAAKNNDYDYKHDIIKEHDTNGASLYSRSYMNRPLRSRETYSYRGQESVWKKNWIPVAVLVIAFLFFVFIAFMYLGIKSDSSAIEASGYVIPICKTSDSASKKGVNCIYESEVTDTINLYEIVKPHLMQLAVEKTCSHPEIQSYVPEADIIQYMRENYAVKDTHQIRNDLTNLEILSFKNPAWGISIIQVESPKELQNKESISQNMEQVTFNRDSKITYLAILDPEIPWSCSAYNLLSSLLKACLFIGVALGVLYVSNLAYKYYTFYKAREHNEVISMVERIIDILQSNASDNNDNCVVINHVRDLILPVVDRKKKQKIWTKAVKFIEESESRVRTEIKDIQGEPLEVWRWLGSSNLSINNSPRNKSWQGQAFETQVGSVNSLPCSPTPCLKIRGMVEDGDRNVLMIKEAVLSKCAHKCRILHCAVDTSSKCVYLKCADPSDAAVAYRNLHGWWYAGHLVTVKYLRLERYMQRFPDSQVNGPPFLKAAGPVGDWTN